MSVAKKRTPYEVLGVPPDADGETVKKAHRKRSRETHPDRGGSAEEFREVSTAFAVISDPMRRQRYDETGSEDRPRDIWRQVLAKAFMESLAKLSAEGRTKNADLVTATKGRLGDETAKVSKTLRDLERGLGAVKKSEKRLKDDKGFLLEVLRAERESLTLQVAVLNESLAEVEKALEYLSDCRFKFDAPDCYVADGIMWAITGAS